MAISRTAKVPTAGPKITYKRSFKIFCCDTYVDDVTNICWSDVIGEEHPDAGLEEFMKLLLPIIDKHAPVNLFGLYFDVWMKSVPKVNCLLLRPRS